jgi:hypothetical protein
MSGTMALLFAAAGIRQDNPSGFLRELCVLCGEGLAPIVRKAFTTEGTEDAENI